MSVENTTPIRQYRFDSGPNYTDDPFSLAAEELAETDNMYYNGKLKTIPGASRLMSTALPSSGVATGMYQYSKYDGTSKFLVATTAGRIDHHNPPNWTSVHTGMSTNVTTRWSWATFNNTLLAVSFRNVPFKYDGTTWANLSGSPPQSKFVSIHQDYVLLAGHTSAPTQIRYSDTNNHNVWPVGNVLRVPDTTGQIITGLKRFGDATVIFLEGSIWLLVGHSPSTFEVHPTLSEVGCISADTIIPVDDGLFFWSEAGPAIFNGVRSILLNSKIQTLLPLVDFTAATRFAAAYYPFQKHLLTSYWRSGQSSSDRILLLDLFRVGRVGVPDTFWPITASGATAMAEVEDSTGRQRIYMGHTSGHVSVWDVGATFNGATVTPRVRTRVWNFGQPSRVTGVRTTDMWVGATATGSLVHRYAVDGATTFTTHGQSGVSMANSGKSYKFIRLDGNGAGELIHGRLIQNELTVSGGGTLTLLGFEQGVEEYGKRND